MKRISLLLLLCLYTPALLAEKYLFFLHSMFLEEAGLDGVHPQYGKYEYREIIYAFRKDGFRVISEIRPKNTDAKSYALKVGQQVDSLINNGVKASDITVVGTSKGGYIAMHVSDLLKNKAVNYVFVGCCEDDIKQSPHVDFYGNVLSIYEKTDTWHSCGQMKKRSGDKVHAFKEIELNTGKKHGFLYKASPLWIQPAIQWAKQDHNRHSAKPKL